MNTSQGEGGTTGPWNAGPQCDRIDDLTLTIPIDGGAGTATVSLDRADAKLLDKLAARTMFDPNSDPIAGGDLGAGPGAGRTTDGDQGGAPNIKKAPAMGEAAAPK